VAQLDVETFVVQPSAISLEPDEVGLDRPSVINCDGIHTVAQTSLSTHVGSVSDATMEKVCSAISYALGC
jgi:mRNA-degrading endonuclease toxin of MazEF toxin-antitoxin module